MTKTPQDPEPETDENPADRFNESICDHIAEAAAVEAVRLHTAEAARLCTAEDEARVRVRARLGLEVRGPGAGQVVPPEGASEVPFTCVGLVKAVEVMTRERTMETANEFAAMLRNLADAVQSRSHAADWRSPRYTGEVQVDRIAMYERHVSMHFEAAARKAASL